MRSPDETPMLSRKRPLDEGNEEEAPLKLKRGLSTLLNQCRTDRVRCFCPHDGETKYLTVIKSQDKLLSSWPDTHISVRRVLQHITFGAPPGDTFLEESVNKRFLDFHRDISEVYGPKDKQHSWAVFEKPEEIVMYGPYYPNYTTGKHSEDFVIKQTQELLDSEVVHKGWKVYVFSSNSPCLTRNIGACMLNLLQKALEWWRQYGVKTHIGYLRCWGFKGSKETLFRDINYTQVNSIEQSENYWSYAKGAEKRTDIAPLCESLYLAVKNLLTCRDLTYHLVSSMQEQDWKNYFKSMSSIFESKPTDEQKVLEPEVNSMITAAKVHLSKKAELFGEHLEKGQVFALRHTFSTESDTVRDQIRLAFQQCWTGMVQDRYADFIKEKLTEDFNQCSVQMFINDVVMVTKEHLQIGRVRFPEDKMP